MIRYVAMIEKKVCLHTKPCRYMWNCNHKKGLAWEPHGSLFSRIGPCRGAVNRAREERNSRDRTGEAYMMLVETDGLVRLPDTAVQTIETLQTKYETLERMMLTVDAALKAAQIAALNAPPMAIAAKPKKRKRAVGT